MVSVFPVKVLTKTWSTLHLAAQATTLLKGYTVDRKCGEGPLEYGKGGLIERE